MKILKIDHVETYEIIKVSRKILKNESMLRSLIHTSKIFLLNQNDLSSSINEKREKEYLVHLE